LKRIDEAIAAYEEGLKHEPTNQQLLDGLKEVKMAAEAEDSMGMGGLGPLFSQPDVFAKLTADPRTRSLMANPNFVAKIKKLQSDPNANWYVLCKCTVRLFGVSDYLSSCLLTGKICKTPIF